MTGQISVITQGADGWSRDGQLTLTTLSYNCVANEHFAYSH
jgi:hypothetical protein